MYKREIFFNLDAKVKLVEPTWNALKYGKIINILFVLFYLRQTIRNTKPDIVFALGYMAFTLAATFGLNTTVVISGRSSPNRVRFPGNRVLNFIYGISHRLLSCRVNGIIAQTSQASIRYTEKYTCTIQVIPNFLRPINEHIIERKNQVITVGRCDVEKGHQFLLRSFAKLNAPQWILVIVGDGPKRSELELEAKELGISDRVVFAGFQKDVDYFLAQSKIFAFTSLHEGFPNALLEAMATPLPCVSFNCIAGPSDIIVNGENGFLVPVGNVNELTLKIQRLIDDESLRSRIERNASAIKTQYAIEKVGERYRFFFKKMVNQK